MVASLEPMMQSSDGQGTSGSLLWLEENSCKAKFHVRLKRRNGRVKLLVSSLLLHSISLLFGIHSIVIVFKLQSDYIFQYEELHTEQAGTRFEAASSVRTIVNQNLLPRVQFNLQLSDK